MAKTLAEAKTILSQQPNGWLMYYFPDNDQYYGGYNYILKFTDEKATVWSELFDGSAESFYKMTTNNGPVLTFDTNNDHFHFLPRLPVQERICMETAESIRHIAATSSFLS